MEKNKIMKTDNKTYKMRSGDWQPLIDAMCYLKHIPKCGDIAERLEEIFSEAQKGRYYFIEMGYENQDGKCFVVSSEFNPYPDNPQPEREFVNPLVWIRKFIEERPEYGSCPFGSMNEGACHVHEGGCGLCIFDHAVKEFEKLERSNV